MEFFRANLWEIRKSFALQAYGGILALVLAMMFHAWWSHGNAPLMYHADPDPMCWGGFESCQWAKSFSSTLMEFLFWSFGLSAALSAIFFLVVRSPGLGWLFLGLAWITRWPLAIQDQRLSSNLHYLVALQAFSYLVIPNKLRGLRWLLTAYYIAHATMNLSPEWLTGQAFTEALGLHVKLAEWLAGITVLIEFLAPISLWFRELRFFLLGYVGLLAGHAIGWYAFGYFQPLAMLALSLLFPLAYYEERKIEREYLYQSFIRPEPNPMWIVLMVGLFGLAQLLPAVSRAGIKINPRLATLAPLENEVTGVECRQVSFLVFANRLEEVEIPSPVDRPPSLRCHPQLRFADLRRLCREKAQEQGFVTITSGLDARRLGQPDYVPIFRGDNLCQAGLTLHDVLSPGAEHGF